MVSAYFAGQWPGLRVLAHALGLLSVREGAALVVRTNASSAASKRFRTSSGYRSPWSRISSSPADATSPEGGAQLDLHFIKGTDRRDPDKCTRPAQQDGPGRTNGAGGAAVAEGAEADFSDAHLAAPSGTLTVPVTVLEDR